MKVRPEERVENFLVCVCVCRERLRLWRETRVWVFVFVGNVCVCVYGCVETGLWVWRERKG